MDILFPLVVGLISILYVIVKIKRTDFKKYEKNEKQYVLMAIGASMFGFPMLLLVLFGGNTTIMTGISFIGVAIYIGSIFWTYLSKNSYINNPKGERIRNNLIRSFIIILSMLIGSFILYKINVLSINYFVFSWIIFMFYCLCISYIAKKNMYL